MTVSPYHAEHGSIVLVGATSTIGRALARRLGAEGAKLVLVGRDASELGRIAADVRIRSGTPAEMVVADLSRADEIEACWRECHQIVGPNLLGLILCQGHLPDQRAAESDPKKIAPTIAINFTSVAVLLMSAANELASRGRGFLCAVSSVAGDRGRQSNYLYGSAKAAVGTFMQGLRHRFASANLMVVTIKPGFVDTRMTWGLPGLFLVATPDRVADDILRAIRAGRSVVYTPWFWRHIMWLIRWLPAPLFHRTRL